MFVFIEWGDAIGIMPAYYESIELFNSFQSPVHPNDVLVVGDEPRERGAGGGRNGNFYSPTGTRSSGTYGDRETANDHEFDARVE